MTLPTLRNPYASIKESLSPSTQRVVHPAEAFITDLESTKQSPYYSERRKLQNMLSFSFGPKPPKPPLKKRIVESPTATSFERSKCSRFQNTIPQAIPCSDTCRLLLGEENIMTTGNEGSDGYASQFQNHLPTQPEPITSSHSVRLIVGQPEMRKVGMNYRAIMDDGAAEARKGAPCQLAEFDVICTRCVMAKKHPGNVCYLQLVRDYKQKLGTRTTFMPFEKIAAARTIVDMVRQRKGRFLFKFKQSEGFYDIGNKQAVRKTFLLLGHYHGEEEDCAQEEEAAPEVLEKLKDLSQSHLASREVVAEVMKLLVIPPRIDPVEWEHFLQKRRARLPCQTVVRVTRFPKAEN